MRPFVSLLLLAGTLSAASAQSTWYVDDDAAPGGDGSQGSPYDALQTAIDAVTTTDGDTLLVLPGSYQEDVDLGGKDLRLVGRDGPDVTILEKPSTRLLTLDDGETVRLEGLTVRDVSLNTLWGGGMYCFGAHVEVVNCVFRECHSYNFGGAIFASSSTLIVRDSVVSETRDGGGIVAYGSDVTLERVVLRSNHSDVTMAGVCLVGCTAEVRNCRIVGNGAFGGGACDLAGGGLFASGSLLLEDCTVIGNCGTDTPGSGVRLAECDATVRRCVFRENRTDFAAGGALAVHNAGPQNVLVEDCSFSRNLGRDGGAVYVLDGTVTFRRCGFWKNLAGGRTSKGGRGGAIFDEVGGVVLERCTLAANEARELSGPAPEGGAYWGDGSIDSSILWDNAPDSLAGSALVAWSDVAGGWPGTGNFEADPALWSAKSGDLHLRPCSPCIDAGNPALPPDADGSPADAGAVPFDPTHRRIGASYCGPANRNSTGSPATLAGFGSEVVTDGLLLLWTTQLPAHEFGLLLMSDTTDFVPFFGGSLGNLCLGVPVLRFVEDVLYSGPAGSTCSWLDFRDLPQGTEFLAGDTWYFQLWFRDDDPAPTSNMSDGLSVVFR